MSRFIQVLQKDIVTKPEQWKNAGPGKFIKLSNKAKNVYSVLSVIAFSAAGNAEGKFASKVGRLGKGWFWTSHKKHRQKGKKLFTPYLGTQLYPSTYKIPLSLAISLSDVLFAQYFI
jgi:hypothetical protein